MAKRGRPKSEFNQAVDNSAPAFLEQLQQTAGVVNADVIEPVEVRRAATAKLRGRLHGYFRLKLVKLEGWSEPCWPCAKGIG